MEEKQTFKLLLATLAVMLVALPFVTTFNSVLTGLVDRFSLYQTAQETVVPFESRLAVGVIRGLGVEAFVNEIPNNNSTEKLRPGEAEASFFLLKSGRLLPVKLEWNCLGWQSLLLLGVSLLTGLQGNYRGLSKLECAVIGLTGTFLMNVLRMVFVALGIYYVNTVFAFLIHDYFAALSTIVWLFVFWWFSYAYVLERKNLV